jgi:hypothetical protein
MTGQASEGLALSPLPTNELEAGPEDTLEDELADPNRHAQGGQSGQLLQLDDEIIQLIADNPIVLRVHMCRGSVSVGELTRSTTGILTLPAANIGPPHTFEPAHTTDVRSTDNSFVNVIAAEHDTVTVIHRMPCQSSRRSPLATNSGRQIGGRHRPIHRPSAQRMEPGSPFLTSLPVMTVYCSQGVFPEPGNGKPDRGDLCRIGPPGRLLVLASQFGLEHRGASDDHGPVAAISTWEQRGAKDVPGHVSRLGDR